MKVSTTSFLLASLYGSALAAPVGGDLGGALESVTHTAGLGNVAPGNIVPENDLTKGLTGAVGQSGSIVGRDAPISGDVVGDALQSVTGKDGLGNVVPGNAVPGNIAPVNDLTEALFDAAGQPAGILGRDGEQKASVILPNYNFLATDHTADVNIKADATNVHARNLDAKAKGIVGDFADADAKAKAQPFAKPPADVNVGANLDTRNLDTKVKGVVGNLVDSDAHAKAHPFAQPPADVNIDANVDAHNVNAKPTGTVDQLTDAVASGVTLADNIAEPTGSVYPALEGATGPDVSGVQALPTGSL